MFDQLTQLVQQFGEKDIVNNTAVPNEHNNAVMEEAGSSIISGLQKMASEGNVEQLAGLFNSNNANDASNPAVKQLTQQLSGNLTEKFGINSSNSSNIAESLVPKVLGSLVNNAKDPNHKGFEISDLVNMISGKNGNSGLMDAVSKYGTQFGLDQNADGKIDMDDAKAAIKSKGGIGGLFGKIFGK